MNHADENRSPELARNVAVALRFKKSQGTPEMPQVEKEVLAPEYNRVRGGNFHLASNARDQDFPLPGMYLRTAIPDRVDVIEQVIAEGDRVGLLFRVTGTHTGNFFGIPPTGRKIDVYEVALLRIVNGRMVEGWFMMDEAELLRQLGARMPARKDGRIVGKDDARAQTRHILRAIEAVLETGGAHLSDIAYNMIFIKRASDYGAVNEVYKEFFPGAAPARFCIICELVKPEFLVEISSVAHVSTMPQEGNYLRAKAANSP